MVARLTSNQKAVGSSPILGTPLLNAGKNELDGSFEFGKFPNG
eukprot:CAMPEP_0194414302 /NCGR_PEP_ID=MMETSP0176-20130528/12935_1 /TAXON_ID=216777 /ORGANISM="Proboscia alata, Strain PI-D3" /LENGTH=42 /DNA_ID= /DNA_START= /DNA_END= /DNA_ORIENTATION=